jgi:peroxiredoxin family protein
VADLIDSSLVVIEGEARAPDEALEILSKKKKDNKECKNKKNNDTGSFQFSLYIPCVSMNILSLYKNIHKINLLKEKKSLCHQSRNDANTDIKVISCSASIRLVGQLVSKTFVHQKASIAEADMAVRQDIMRSLASRLEMHWDSLIQEENGSPEGKLYIYIFLSMYLIFYFNICIYLHL